MVGLLTREIEVIFLERLARDPAASAWNSIQMSEVEVCDGLKRRLPHFKGSVQDVLTAAASSAAISFRQTPAQVVDGLLSRYTLRCQPRQLPGVTPKSGQQDFARLVREFNAAGQRPVARLPQREVVIKEAERTVTLTNGGYGQPDDIQVVSVTAPPWVTWSVQGRQVTFRPHPQYNGCYRGDAVIHSNAGDVTCLLIMQHWRCPPTTDPVVDWRSLVTMHPQIDQDAMRAFVEQGLLARGYRPLTGGFFARGDDEAAAPDHTITTHWKITAQHLKLARLPASGHAPLVRLYSPDGSERYDIPFDGEALHGEALAELFAMWQVKGGRELHLTPYRGHYQFEVHRPGGWLNARAAEYGLVTTPDALNKTPHLWDHLEDWVESGRVRVLLQGDEPGVLTDLRRRFPKHLFARSTEEPIMTSRLYFFAANGEVVSHGLPDGQLLQRSAWPESLWEKCAPRAKPRVTPTPAPAVSAAAETTVMEYTCWQGSVNHPLEVNSTRVWQDLRAILMVEGPMVGHHLYHRYSLALSRHRGRAIPKPMELKRILNPILYQATQRKELIAADEFGTGGQIGLVYRLPEQPVRARAKGDRPLEYIPRSELRMVIRNHPGLGHLEKAEQVKWVLEQFGFGPFLPGAFEQIKPLLPMASPHMEVNHVRRRARETR